MTTRRPITSLLAVFIALALVPHALSAAFEITGRLAPDDPATLVTVQRESLEDRAVTVIAHAPITAGQFTLSVPTEAGLFKLQIGSTTLPFVAATGDRLTLKPDAAKPGAFTLTGGDAHTRFTAYETFRTASLAQHVLPVRAAARTARAADDQTAIERLTEEEVVAYDTHRRELVDFTLTHLAGSPALYAASLRWDGDYRLPELAAVIDAFAAAAPDLAITTALQSRIARFRATALGAIAPPLAGPTPAGDTLALANLRGRHVLVDFWAAWCPPCRIENRHYVDLYRKYGDAGLEIFAVSVDHQPAAWRNAIADDNATWLHISDLTGWRSPLAAAYNVSALPASFLLDPEGRIIAKNLRGPALAAKLAELFPDA